MSHPSITEALTTVNAQIRAAEKTWGRTENSVTLLAVSKRKPVAEIREAMDAGQLDFGENYVDEAMEKITALQNAPCRWHYIGAIQSNKTRLIATHFDWAHGIDRIKIAQRLSDQRPKGAPPLNCCIQLNVDQEASKAGCRAEELAALGNAMQDMPNIILRGLMVIPATRTDFAEQRKVFSQVNSLFLSYQQQWPGLDTLSMGMSGDMEAAIAEGSTMVRIGTAIFGQRDDTP